MREIIVNNKTYKVSLEYIFGLYEGDGSITIQLKPNKSHKTGKQIILILEIHQHVIDVDLLKAISIFLGCGKVEVGRKVGSPDTWVYRLRISTQADILNNLLPILQSQSMMLKKRSHDMQLFIESCLIVKDKKHTTEQGQAAINTLASQLSSKLTLEGKEQLPDIDIKLNPERILGFTDAEGHFSFTITKPKNNSNHTGVIFNFLITQEKSEIKFLNELIKFFGCGNVFTNEKGGGVFAVHNKQDLATKIIPFFESNELQTIKNLSFIKFKKALEICMFNKPLLSHHIEDLNRILIDQNGKRPQK
jgi:hypothetical protein